MKYLIALIAALFFLAYETTWLISQMFPEKFSLLWSSFPVFIKGHVSLSLATAFLASPYVKERFKIPWYWFSVLGTFMILLLLPIFGAFLYVAAFVYFAVVRQDRELSFTDKEEEREIFEMFEFEKPEESEQEFKDVVARQLEIEPYVDILRGYDLHLKKGAVNKLSKIVSPESVSLLKLALQDDSPEVRLLASRSLSKIEESIGDEILTASKKVTADPKDVASRNILGHIYLRYARLGLLDAATQKFYFQKVINEFLTSLQLEPHQEKILLEIGQLFLAVQRYEKAEEIFRKIIELNPGQMEPRFYLCEAYLGRGDIAAIKKECFFMKENFELDRKQEELLDYWVEHEGKDRKTLK